MKKNKKSRRISRLLPFRKLVKSLTLQAFLDFSIYRKLLSFKSKCPVKHDRCEKDFCSSTKNSFPISDASASTRSAAKDFDISFASYSGLTGEKQASSIFNLLRSVSFFNVQSNFIYKTTVGT